MTLEDRLTTILRQSGPLMEVLRTVRGLSLPDALVFSGAIYQRLLNAQTRRPLESPARSHRHLHNTRGA